MEYETIKEEIDKKIQELALEIEKFCTVYNTEYDQSYKDDLWKLHRKIEELLK